MNSRRATNSFSSSKASPKWKWSRRGRTAPKPSGLSASPSRSSYSRTCRAPVATKDFEGESNFRTVEELQSVLDSKTFWRVHRSYLVNINRIKEIIPWFKSSYQLKMDDRKQTSVPVSRAQTRKLRELLNL